MIDFFEWDRRALPLPEVHIDTGPLAPAELGDWVMQNIRRPAFHLVHPGLWQAHAAAVAYLQSIPPGAVLVYTR